MGGIEKTYSDNGHPFATILECTRHKSIIHTRLRLERTPSSPISPASLWVGDPPDINAYTVVSLHRLTAHEGQLFTFDTFEEFAPQSTLPPVGAQYRYVSWWMPSQLALARSDPRDLYWYHFEPRSPGSHDHCFLCWKTIGVQQGDEREAYTNGRDSLCFACYEKFITSGFGKILGDAA
jgi:hypothetical protein